MTRQYELISVLKLEEDYTKKAKNAVAAPFNIEKSLNIADSQYNGALLLRYR